MKEKGIYFEHRQVYEYPINSPYNPSIAYPEYQWKDTELQEDNKIYDMVRSCFYKSGMDAENYGNVNWNPLGDIVKQGNEVLIKPNMVLHENGIVKNGMNCLITHPSVVRAVVDYVLIALKGSGQIIIGDASLQSCNFERLTKEQGYDDLIIFYKNCGVNVSLHDFRLFKSIVKAGIIINKLNENKDFSNYTTVDLGSESMFSDLPEERLGRLRVTDYDPNVMIKHHNSIKHEYLIPNIVLSADVVINMPKPKTHKKSGATISLKNMLGIVGHKDWLPHHAQGSLEENGDEYLTKSPIKHLKVILQEKIDRLSLNNRYLYAIGLKNIQLIFRILGKLFDRDSINSGSWYGNDTLWRTILDLNRIIQYADKNGVLCEKQQRNLFVVGDMIISGEKEGPLMPSPKRVGIINVGTNFTMYDIFCATVMGFDVNKISSINNAKLPGKYPLVGNCDEYVVKSNNELWNNKRLSEIDKNATFKYIPAKGWEGHIEL